MHSVPFPEGMGLSENSATVRDLRDSKRLLHGVLLTQPGVAELVSWARENKSLLDYAPTLVILFSSNLNIHKSLSDHCFWSSDPLIDRFY